MKINFLGTGAAEGVPALFCGCTICDAARRQGGKDRRFRTTALIDDTIRIDFPPDALAQVHFYPDLPLWDISHLLFTHSHDDHFASRELQYLSPNFAPYRNRPLRVWGTDYLLDLINRRMDGVYEQPPLDMNPVKPFCEYTIDHLTVVPITAHHKVDEVCLNYLLTENATGKTLLYASDTGWYNPETWEFLQGRRVDAVVLECGLGGAPSGYEGHLSLAGCVSAREMLISGGGFAETSPFILTHISHTGLLLHDELVEHAAPHNIDIAYDGMELIL